MTSIGYFPEKGWAENTFLIKERIIINGNYILNREDVYDEKQLDVEPQTASMLYEDSVTVEDLQNYGIDESNPLAALVTSVDFGRLIVVKISTSNTRDNIETAAKATLFEIESENKDEYKRIMDSASCDMFVLGGKTDTAAELIKQKCSIEEIRKIIASDTDFTSESAAFPLSYATNFIDDGSRAVISRSTEYVKTTVSKRGKIHFKTESAGAYVTKHQKLWGKAVTGIESEGHLELGDWECLLDAGSGSQENSFSGKYVELDFEFDITWGTDWPYSNVFWTADKGAAEDVFIDMGGACRTASIRINVNGETVFRDGNCNGHNSMFGSRS